MDSLGQGPASNYNVPNNTPISSGPPSPVQVGGVFTSAPYKDGVYEEPPFIKPNHFSDIDHWKFPERNYYVFICISFILGFFGLDHFYLRSFGTGMQKCLFNIFSLGMWYFWDIVQIVSDSKRVKEEGLTTPFDWVRGVGRGVFEDPVAKAEALQSGGQIARSKKDIAVYALCALLFGIFGLDKLYLGAPWQAVAKLLSCFNIFIFLFGWMWVIWDIVRVVFFTESVLKDGISPPPPFNFLFPEPIKADDLFVPSMVSKEERLAEQQAPIFGGMPGIDLSSFRFFYKELAVPLLQPTVGTSLQTADKTLKTTEKVSAVGGEILATAPKIAAAVTQNLASVVNPDKLMEQVKAAAAAKAASRQTGGGGELSSGPIIAGTLAAVVLAGAAKFATELLSSKK